MISDHPFSFSVDYFKSSFVILQSYFLAAVVVNSYPAGAFVDVHDKSVNIQSGSLDLHVNIPAVQVPYPAGTAVALGQLLDGPAEAHTLYLASENDVISFLHTLIIH